MKRIVKKMHGRRNDPSDYVIIDMADVKYIDLWRDTGNNAKTLAYHTIHGSYLDIQGLSDAAISYADEGFIQVDPSTIIRYPMISEIRNVKGGSVIYFIDGTHIFVRKKL